nr:type II toxin-antitoxin system HicA family toxin [Candidatus Sigynarchaeota archaeon]
MSGEKLKKLLIKLGYELVRQKGSHMQLKKTREGEEHVITVPKHDEIAPRNIKRHFHASRDLE